MARYPGAPNAPKPVLLGVGLLEGGKTSSATSVQTCLTWAPLYPRAPTAPRPSQLGQGLLQVIRNYGAFGVQSLGGLTQAASSTETFSGTSAQRLGGLTQAASSTETFSGTSAQRLAALAQAAVGLVTFGSTSSQRVGGLNQSVSVSQNIPCLTWQTLYPHAPTAPRPVVLGTGVLQVIGPPGKALVATAAQSLSSLAQASAALRVQGRDMSGALHRLAIGRPDLNYAEQHPHTPLLAYVPRTPPPAASTEVALPAPPHVLRPALVPYVARTAVVPSAVLPQDIKSRLARALRHGQVGG